MDDEQFRAAMESENPDMQEIENIATERNRKSEEENKTAHENQAKKEREEAARREELVKRMNNGETLTPDVLSDIFEKPIDKDSDDSDDKTNNG